MNNDGRLVVVHVTASRDEAAGRLTYDLHSAMLDEGIDSWVLTRDYSSAGPRVIRLHRSALGQKMYDVWRLLISRIEGASRIEIATKVDYHFNKYSEIEYYSANRLTRMLPPNVDVVIIHFYDGLLNSDTIGRLRRNTGARILWLMMDMFPITGGCHYSWGCRGYNEECGCCPALESNEENDRSRVQMRSKLRALARYDGIELVVASEWQFRQASDSALFRNKKIHKILTAVSPSVFFPRLDMGLRQSRNLTPGMKHILFGARYINERRKGFALFTSAMVHAASLLDDASMNETVVLLAGEGSVDEMVGTGWSFNHLGVLSNDEFAEILGMTDLYVCASIEDSGPTMINQAIMSGVPVISFEMGVALDLVINGETGYRVPLGDVEEMARRIAQVLSMSADELQNMKQKVRSFAMDILTPSKQLDAFLRCIQ